MPNLELTAAERDMLRDILKNYLSDFRMEISQTDTPDYRAQLKDQEAMLNKIIDKLGKAM
ncbi:hypothetical protein [Dehalogenimonas alkenigignens]|uniref:Uncharacterized protein n=1 Tax=Dehalogenimonas alkenigignens TaxID=1217799 RepID=A0A0W0GKX2_9CHLR|nr:hypothetical protein [Dehalogenimonas alkenigignens]KTB49223.1 hypothetical protein DEALK_01350 [Dehalogenimonas alkenigignens]PVV83729.1 hypothetical protein DD509_05735 [Dehalogenimonas alkenigignens]